MGVNLFFVLSGFIIFFAHGKDIGHVEKLGTYVWRRVTRVYPVYWVFLTVFIVAALSGFGHRTFRLTWGDLMSAYTLTQLISNPTLPLKVAWTLVFEISFYAMFAASIVNRWIGAAGFALWLTIIFISSFSFGSLEIGWTSMWNINFYYGALAYWLFKRIDHRWGVHLLVTGIALLAVLITFHGGYSSIESQQAAPFWLMVIGLPFCLILLGSALAERHYGFSPPKILVMLGETSFATYLVHSAVISAMCQILHRHAAGILPPQLAFGTILLVAMLIGAAAHFLVERPILRVIKRSGMFRNSAPLARTAVLIDNAAAGSAAA